MKTVTIVCLFLLSLPAVADNFDQTLKVSKPGVITVDVHTGEVEVIGWNKSEVRVVGDLPKRGEGFEFVTKGNDVRIETSGDSGFWGRKYNNGNTDFKIYCPIGSSIRAEGTSTSFSIKGISGSVDVTSLSGNIDLQGGSGKVDLESVSGDVSVKDAKGKFNLSSVSGDVVADVLATIFDAQTVSGNIDAEVGTSERIDLESVSGDIDITFAFGDHARLEANTVSGDVDLMFTNNDINATFDIETGPGGDIRNRLSEHKSINSFSMSGSLQFKLGSGEGSINIDTMSGSVRLEN